MKILQVIPFFAPKFGGPVNSVYLLAVELVKRGHSVTILTSDLEFDERYVNDLEKFDINVVPFHIVASFGLFMYTPSMKGWLEAHISDYDVVHIHNFRAYQNSLVGAYAKEKKIPVVLQARGSVLPFFQKQLLKHLYDLVWGYDLLNKSSRFIALCESEAAQYRKMGVSDDKIVIIPNGIDISRFSDLPAKGSFRSQYSISDDENIILFLGRIHKIKGIDILVRAYAELLQEMPDATLAIVGPDERYLSIIKDQIQHLNLKKEPLITGPLYNREKLSAYIDADVYVLPSRYETFPNTVLEAWACGTPVVVTDGCLIADTVGRAGCVSSYSVLGLKQAILKTLMDDEKRIENVDSGLVLIKNDFNLVSCVNKIEDLYREVIDQTDDERVG